MNFKSFAKDLLPYGITNRLIIKNKEMAIPSSDEPPVYNSQGQKLKTIFLKSDISRHWPYGFITGQFPRYTLWDRNNYGLNNHVYAHNKILETIGKPIKKFAFFLESEAVVPEDYMLFERHRGLAEDFDVIFTYSTSLLDKYSNAAFIPASGVWYGTQLHGGLLNPERCYTLKTKNVSIISSDRVLCDLHKFRIAAADHYKHTPLVDTFGTFDGGPYAKITDHLDKYRYSISIENDISPYYFTEKILNCFASMAVPIYIGAAKINDFFNPDGIIQVKTLTLDAIDSILAGCSEQDYTARIPAIIDNYNRINDFLCVEDYMFTHYKHRFA